MAARPRFSPAVSIALALVVSLTVAGLTQTEVGARAAAPPRFFFSGDGEIEMRGGHFDESLRVRYRDAGGRYDPEALAAIEHFFRSRSDGAAAPISLRLIELIDYVEDHYHLESVTLVSGYRSPELNQSLRDDGRRVAQASLHTEGLAADLALAGVDLRRLWMKLRQAQVGGVGLYQKDGFLHLDTGAPRFWEAATSGVEKNLSAENARLFARTDFDRYRDLDGAVVSLHAVTATPLGVSREAHLGGRRVALSPRDEAAWVLRDDCWVIAAPAPRYELVVAASAAPPDGRTSLRLHTCGVRVGATPAEVSTNPVAPWHDSAAASP